MRRLLLLTVIAASTIIGSTSVLAQSAISIEKDLLAKIKKVISSSAYTGVRDDTALEKANDDLKQALIKYAGLAATLKYAFPRLSKEIDVVTSADKRFRVYTWDRQDGGTMHFYETVYQYIGADGKSYGRGVDPPEDPDEDVGDSGAYVIDVYMLDTKPGRAYLVQSSSRLSSSEITEQIDLFRIDGNKLDTDPKLIKTAEGLTSSLGFEFDLFSVLNLKKRPIRLIKYDAAAKTITLPVVIPTRKYQYGMVTSRKITYKFNGIHFVKIG